MNLITSIRLKMAAFFHIMSCELTVRFDWSSVINRSCSVFFPCFLSFRRTNERKFFLHILIQMNNAINIKAHRGAFGTYRCRDKNNLRFIFLILNFCKTAQHFTFEARHVVNILREFIRNPRGNILLIIYYTSLNGYYL